MDYKDLDVLSLHYILHLSVHENDRNVNNLKQVEVFVQDSCDQQSITKLLWWMERFSISFSLLSLLIHEAFGLKTIDSKLNIFD